MTAPTDFYLGSGELTAWAQPRAVAILEDLSDGARAELDPPAPDGARTVVLRPRYAGDSIRGSQPPVTVNIFLPDETLVGIGELYRTREEAARTDGGLGS